MKELAIGQVWYKKGTREPVTITEFYKHHGEPGVGIKPELSGCVYGVPEKVFRDKYRDKPVDDVNQLFAELAATAEKVQISEE